MIWSWILPRSKSVNKWKDPWTDGRTNGLILVLSNGETDEWMDGWKDRWMVGRIDGWMEG